MLSRRAEKGMDVIRDVLVGLAVILAGLALFASDADLGLLSAQFIGGTLMALGVVLTVGPLLAVRRRGGRQD